jgi:hypothetical protein
MPKGMIIASAFALVVGLAGAGPSLMDAARPAPGCSGWFQGAACPDGTASISRFTGEERDGDGWIGDSDGIGGPSAVPYLPQPRRSAGGIVTGAPNQKQQFAQAEGTSSGHTMYGRGNAAA